MSNNSNPPIDSSITWARVRAIFNNPAPPDRVWQSQFDGFDEKLEQLAQTPYDQIDFGDLWYYHHDLAYVKLQPELFAWLFPVCLMDWDQTLQNSKSCSHGDSEFHYGILQGNVFETMLTGKQLEEVTLFFRDSLLKRVTSVTRLMEIRNELPSFGWLYRFNSLGVILPDISPIWEGLWSLKHPGQAIAAIQYFSALLYFDDENPLFKSWHTSKLNFWENDSFILGSGWTDNNADYLTTNLTVEFVNVLIQQAAVLLGNTTESQMAEQIKNDLPGCQALLRERVKEFPELLRNPDSRGWTV
ncbi:hypothetical protein Pan110_40760 [Gimesia panareensis]|nr:hypothetical protein Pan110_40760 [Gimesia panareensis]